MTASLLGLNPWVSLICSVLIIAGMVWGTVWGGIKYWHHRAGATLETTFSKQLAPVFDDIKQRFEFVEVHMQEQDRMLEVVKHEVSLNSGQSVKDGVNTLRRESEESARRQKDILAEQRKAADLQLTTNERIADLRGDLQSHLSYHDGVEDGKRTK